MVQQWEPESRFLEVPAGRSRDRSCGPEHQAGDERWDSSRSSLPGKSKAPLQMTTTGAQKQKNNVESQYPRHGERWDLEFEVAGWRSGQGLKSRAEKP